MRVIVCYNGVSTLRPVLSDLRLTGLPPLSSLKVLSFVDPFDSLSNKREAERDVRAAVLRLAKEFEPWDVSGNVVWDMPAESVISRSEDSSADLIMIGEPADAEFDRASGLGAVSRKIVAGSGCSVRICRRNTVSAGRRVRILVGFDGSEGSKLAVNAILRRAWPPGSRVRFVAVVDSVMISSIGRFTPQIWDAAIGQRFVEQWAQNLCGRSRQKLEEAGMRTEFAIRSGEAAANIISEAVEWSADTIFLGPNGSAFPSGRRPLGSVALSVASRSGRSVEICR